MKRILKIIMSKIKCFMFGIKYNKGLYIGKGVKFSAPKSFQCGSNVNIRPYCDIFAKMNIGSNVDIGTRNRFGGGSIFISDNVIIGPNNYITSSTHIYDDVNIPIIEQGYKLLGDGVLKIKEGTWIGTNCAIIGGITIGKHCVIGANSVVTKDVPNYSVVAGNPAKIIKKYNFITNKWEKV